MENKKYNPNDTIYYIKNNSYAEKATVMKRVGNLYLIRFENGGGIQLPGHRLYETKELAEEKIPRKNKEEISKPARDGYYYNAQRL